MHRSPLRRSAIRLAVLVIVAIGSSAGMGVEAPSITDPPVRVEIHGGSAEQRAIVTRAVERFHEVGLDFSRPPIYLHEGTGRCEGNGGFSTVLPEGMSVHICVEDNTDLARKVLHEVAHVWDFGFGDISPETRATFLALRGLDDWNDRTHDWPKRGAEQAAEIIAWGLQENIGSIPTRVALIGPNDLDSLAAAFEVLVGAPPLWMEEVNRLRFQKSTGAWQDV